jgi:hypothetical protein
MRGYHPGITVFGNEMWRAENTGFDINSTVLDAARLNSTRELQFMNGRDLQLLTEKEKRFFSVTNVPAELPEKLQKFGQEMQVEVIFLIFDGVSKDVLGQTSARLTGFGAEAGSATTPRYRLAGRLGCLRIDRTTCHTSRVGGIGERLHACSAFEGRA